MTSEAKREQAKAQRYKRAALDPYGAELMQYRLSEIQEQCDDVRYCFCDTESLIDALDGDVDEANEFQILIAQLASDCEQITDMLYDGYFELDDYDDCTVAAIGGMLQTVGFDNVERNYFNLDQTEASLAEKEAQKRLMRKTKQKIVETFYKSWRIFLTFFDLEQRYMHLKATMEIVKGDNAETINAVREIEKQYELMYANYTGAPWTIDREAEKKLDRLINSLPDRCFVE